MRDRKTLHGRKRGKATDQRTVDCRDARTGKAAWSLRLRGVWKGQRADRPAALPGDERRVSDRVAGVQVREVHPLQGMRDGPEDAPLSKMRDERVLHVTEMTCLKTRRRRAARTTSAPSVVTKTS